MTVSFVWIGIKPLFFVPFLIPLTYFIFTRFYIRDNKKSWHEKEKIDKMGRFALIYGVCVLVVPLISSVQIVNNGYGLAVAIISGIIAMALIYLDGWLTDKAVYQEHVAKEANPIMEWLISKLGMKGSRWFVFSILLGLTLLNIVIMNIPSIWMFIALWIIIDTSNIITLKVARERRRIQQSALVQEVGLDTREM